MRNGWPYSLARRTIRSKTTFAPAGFSIDSSKTTPILK